MTSPLAGLIERFPGDQPMVDVWRRWPDVTEAEYVAADTWECVHAAQAFAEQARAAGFTATVVIGKDSEQPFDEVHAWTVITGADGLTAVDWTARQFYNLQEPPAVEHADLPCPMVWHPQAVGEHPISGPYRVLEFPTSQED